MGINRNITCAAIYGYLLYYRQQMRCTWGMPHSIPQELACTTQMDINICIVSHRLNGHYFLTSNTKVSTNKIVSQPIQMAAWLYNIVQNICTSLPIITSLLLHHYMDHSNGSQVISGAYKRHEAALHGAYKLLVIYSTKSSIQNCEDS